MSSTFLLLIQLFFNLVVSGHQKSFRKRAPQRIDINITNLNVQLEVIPNKHWLRKPTRYKIQTRVDGDPIWEERICKEEDNTTSYKCKLLIVRYRNPTEIRAKAVWENSTYKEYSKYKKFGRTITFLKEGNISAADLKFSSATFQIKISFSLCFYSHIVANFFYYILQDDTEICLEEAFNKRFENKSSLQHLNSYSKSFILKDSEIDYKQDTCQGYVNLSSWNLNSNTRYCVVSHPKYIYNHSSSLGVYSQMSFIVVEKRLTMVEKLKPIFILFGIINIFIFIVIVITCYVRKQKYIDKLLLDPTEYLEEYHHFLCKDDTVHFGVKEISEELVHKIEISRDITNLRGTTLLVKSFDDKEESSIERFHLDTKYSSLKDQMVETNNIRATFQSFSELELSSLTDLIEEDKNVFEEETSNYVKKY